MEFHRDLSIGVGEHRPFEPKLIHRIFEEIAEENSEKLAIEFTDKYEEVRKYDFQRLNVVSNKIANSIFRLTLGSRANDDGDWVIAICMSHSDNMVVTILAALKSGAAYMPLDPDFPVNRIQQMLNETQPCLCIYDSDYGSHALFEDYNSISYEDILEHSSTLSPNSFMRAKTFTLEQSDLALVFYTSGSTGVPEGVKQTHTAILNRLNWSWAELPFSATENYGLFRTDFAFIDSICEIFGPLLKGNPIVIAPKSVQQDIERFVGILEKYKIERCVMVPALIKTVLIYLSSSKKKKMLRHLRIWINSGEPIPLETVLHFFDYYQNEKHFICNFYGCTELMADVVCWKCNNKKVIATLRQVPIGFPIYNTAVYILDESRQPLLKGQVGEIYISGLNLSLGYVKNRNAMQYSENHLSTCKEYAKLYRTGDFGYMNKSGLVFYEGRTDGQIKIRDHRVDLSEVEKILMEINEIKKGFVLCYHVGQEDQTLVGFVQLEEQKVLTGIMIQDKLRRKLVDYMIPQIIVIPEFPYLSNGKLDRQALLNLYELDKIHTLIDNSTKLLKYTAIK